MSEAVVDQFEPVEVDEQDSEKGTFLTSGLDCRLEAVNEVRPVWDVGKWVRDFAFGNIGQRAGHPDSVAGRVADGDTTTKGPDVSAGLMAHPVFTNELGRFAVEMHSNSGTYLLAIVVVNMV